MGAKYSYGVWERFAHQASIILKTLKNQPKSRSVNICLKCSVLAPEESTKMFVASQNAG